MSSIKIAVLAGLFTATASAALAADLPRNFFSPAPAMRATRPSTEGWYLRGDIGYVHHKRPEADFSAGDFRSDLLREDLGDAAGVGLGIGYRFSPNFRMDVTADHFSSRFKGTAPTPTFATVSVADRASLQSSAFLVNGYVDFGSMGGFTPYVGAGIGLARNVFSDYTRTTYDAVADLETWQRLAGGDDRSFAWALMAGVGYRLSSNFSLDLGYRYVSRGDMKTRSYEAGAGSDVESIGTHEVRLGVRYGL
ncbi:outer membrane protein [Microvirga lenta]|uniref:outer membrane protein n=1 Tax=Microvirga lenta TaxID=2881337 RepID=UPI001CFF861A|nr:outer membrane beta-barrel protein [Microvirga lenta]MCB5177557.1 outer membrane beta-barrel protein [Microvirga lenta]